MATGRLAHASARADDISDEWTSDGDARRSQRRARRGPLRRSFACVVALCLAACGGGPISSTQDLPDDVRSLVDGTWETFESTLPAIAPCFGSVELRLVRDVSGGAARYDDAAALIEIEIPTTPARFAESLVHELAHHLEHACGVVDDIGPAFLRAQGFDAGSDWFVGDRWQSTPSEHYAEAVVAVVLGRRITHADIVDLSDTAIATVAEWGRTARSD